MSFAEPAYAVLNATLAILVLRVRPVRTGNAIVALLFGLNAVSATLGALIPETQAALDALFTVAILSHAPLLALPFVFPVRRVSSRAAWGIVGASAVALLFVGLGRAVSDATWIEELYAVFYLGVPAVGVAVLAASYLGAPSDISARQASFVLGAYLVKLCVVLVMPAGLTTPVSLDVAGAFSVLARAALVGVVLAIAYARVRGTTRPVLMDLLVLAAIPAGSAIAAIVREQSVEYLLIRPLLFAYAILRFQLLDVDVRERAGSIGITLLAAVAAVFVETQTLLARDGADLATAIGAALVVALGAAGVIAWPVARALVERPGGSEMRGREIYIAALSEAAESPTDTSGGRVLQALRHRLGISEREHAVLEASVRASRGTAEGLREGAVFLGRYHVRQLLGEGGFARTWLARDDQVGRDVVLKVARAASTEEGRQLAREARLLARAGHPNIVTVYDVEVVGDEVILVLEYVPGGSLAARLEQGPLPLDDALRLADDLLAALDAAHQEGIVHRDVKPANVLLAKDGRAKLADFGVARAPATSDTVSGLSMEGRQPGSLRYMSPEQVRGAAVDPRSDLYSAAAVLYEAIAGRPYLDLRGRAEFDIRLAILQEEPRPLEGVPPAVWSALTAALRKDAAARPASAAAFRAALRAHSVSPRTE